MVQTIRLQRILLANLLVLLVVAMGYTAVTSGSPVLIATVLFLPLAIYFVNNPVHLLIGSFLVGAAGITYKALPAELTLQNILHAFVIAVCLGALTLKKERRRRGEVSELFLLGFVLLIFLTISVRGSGLRVLGSDMWGGRAYVILLLACGFYIFAPMLRLRHHHVSILVYGMLVAGLLPAFVQIAFLASGGAFYILAYFFEANLQTVAAATFEGDPTAVVTRFSTLRDLGLAVLPFAFIVPYRGWTQKVMPLAIVLVSLVMIGLSGFRGALLGALTICGLWGLFSLDKGRRVPYLATLAALGLAGWVFLIYFAQALPQGIQRAVSWVPLVNVSELAQRGAMYSTTWRVEIWRMAMAEVPDHLLIGKGLSFIPYELPTQLMDSYYDRARFAFLTHNYHSGPLGLLVDFGIPGLVLVTGFFITSCRENLAPIHEFSRPRLDHLYYRFSTIAYLWAAISYYLIFGDVRKTFIAVLVAGALLRILRYSLQEEMQEEREAAKDHAPAEPEPPAGETVRPSGPRAALPYV